MNTLISKAAQTGGASRGLKSGLMSIVPDEASCEFEMHLLGLVDGNESNENHSLASESISQGKFPVDLFNLQAPLLTMNPLGMESFAIGKQETETVTSEERLMAASGLYVAHEPDYQQPLKNALPQTAEELSPDFALSPHLPISEEDIVFSLRDDHQERLDLPNVPEQESGLETPIAILGTPESPELLLKQAWQLTQSDDEATPAETPLSPMREAEPVHEAPKSPSGYHQNPAAAASPSMGANITTVSSSGGTGTMSTEPAPVFQQIADHLERLVRLPGEDSVRIQMDPPDLGALDINVRVQGNEVQAQVSAEQDWTRRMIEQTIEQLRQMMEERGLQLRQFDVHTGGAFQQGFAQDRPSSQDQQKEPANNMARSRVWDINPLGQWSVWI